MPTETAARAEGVLMDRALGLAWFAFIPLTLWMLLALPLGPGWSLLVAAVTIAAHRPLASRWVHARGQRRCLWCGGAVHDGQRVLLEGVPPLGVCGREAPALDRFLNFCARNASALRVGILVPVLGYFTLGALAVWGVEPLSHEVRRHLFRGPIALCVVTVALLHRFVPAQRPGRFPFPIHNLALLGVRVTLLVFLGVGLWWLAVTGRALLPG
jgi:hypothetical protein